MNAFYQKKAAVPREARNGDLRNRLVVWRDKRLLNVAAACEKTPDKFRQKFGILHLGFAKKVDKILKNKDENLVEEINLWISNLEKSFLHHKTGANRDAVGLCGTELKFILSSWQESNK